MERRLHVRLGKDAFGVEIRVLTRIPQKQDDYDLGTVLDLSEGGMLFSSETAMEQGTLVILSFLLPDSEITIITEALIIHCCLCNNFSSTMGSQFRNLGFAERMLIRTCIEKYSIHEHQ